MSEREYHGDPLDMRWTYTADLSGGDGDGSLSTARTSKSDSSSETEAESDDDIAMNSDDSSDSTDHTPPTVGDHDGETVTVTGTETGETATQWLPSHIDAEDLTDSEKSIITTAVQHPGWDQPQIADGAGTTPSAVSRTLGRYDVDHPSREDPSQEGTTPARARIREAADEYPYATIQALANAVGSARKTVRSELQERRPDHPAINRGRSAANRIAAAVRENGGDTLRPYETTTLEPGPLGDPEGLTDVTRTRSDDGADTDSELTAPDDGPTAAADGGTEAASLSDDATEGSGLSAEQQLAAVRERAGVIARVTDDKRVVDAVAELYRTAGGRDHVWDASRYPEDDRAR